MKHNQPNETPSPDVKEVAVSRRLGPEGGILVSRTTPSSPVGEARTEGMLCTQV